MSMTEDLVEVYSVGNPAQLAIIQGLLEEIGVEVFVVNEGMEGVTGEVPHFYARPRIWVKSSDVPRASKICQDFDQRLQFVTEENRGEATPFCFHCGEETSIDATRCDTCGGDLSR